MERKKERVELHVHTKMSQMDGIVNPKDLVDTAYKLRHKAVTITDYSGCQAFPEAYDAVCSINQKNKDNPFKVLYGTELTIIDDTVDYNDEKTSIILQKKLKNITKIKDIDKMISKDEIYKYGNKYHINLIAKNKKGLKNLYKLISYANTKYLYKTPRILKSEVEKYREGLLIGSSCSNGEIFSKAQNVSDEELSTLIDFYDYVEVQPIEAYEFLNKDKLINCIKRIIKITKKVGKLIVASGNVHYLNKEDKICREALVNQKYRNEKLNPKLKKIPNQHFRTTNEMLNEFNFLDEEEAKEIVITNTNNIADMVEYIDFFQTSQEKTMLPNAQIDLNYLINIVYDKAKEIYGNSLPNFVENRLKQELYGSDKKNKGIIGTQFETYLILAHKLTQKIIENGNLIGTRGTVASSFVAYLLGISDINPLTPHYICPNCKKVITTNKNNQLETLYENVYDMPDLECKKCNIKMKKEGHNIPYESFIGLEKDKYSDIVLNYSETGQVDVLDYAKEIFGNNNVYCFGAIETIDYNTAFDFIKDYCEENKIVLNDNKKERLVNNLLGVKKNTKVYPGRMTIIPNNTDIFDYSPYQYPSNDTNASHLITHFDYYNIYKRMINISVLPNPTLSKLNKIRNKVKENINDILFEDNEIRKVLSSKIIKEIPEFNNDLTKEILKQVSPQNINDLIKIFGLALGAGTWENNAEILIKNDKIALKDVIATREDIMLHLIKKGLSRNIAFEIMEFVRNGRATKEIEKWQEYQEKMKNANVENWFIESCQKIYYLFPKAHVINYVINAYKLAFYKIYNLETNSIN